MNKNRHRIVFNAARGQHMAVSETARSLGGPSSPPMPALAFAALLMTLLAPAQAQVVADPSAPGNQRPTILQTANGLPQINIQTPSAAGVSRNTYRQFDVQSNGVILNNSRTNVQTQIGGFVSGNPWIGTPARVILNEVNSSNPIRSTDAEAGIARIFEKERVQKEIEAQTKITEMFSREAPKAVASYAASQERALKDQLDAETDPAKQEALKAEIDKWKEGGAYRVALHTAVGALGGGWSGAAGAAVSGASANLLQAMQDSLQESLEEAGLGDGVAKGIAQGIATLTAAGMGAAVGGAYGAASAATVDANNRQLHPTEAKLIKENARRFAQKLYGTNQPTSEQIEAAQAMLTNTAQNAVDSNWGFEVPYFEAADAFLQELKIDYQQKNGTLTLPGTSGQPGGAQQLFYADVEQKNQAWINQGLADPAITGLIVRTPIKPQTNPDALDPSRDRLTGLPLDDKGRYTVRVDVGNSIDGYETYTPKYFPCATAECVRSGQNLDMSDPETQAYVRALDAQVFKDIGTGATVGTLVTPVGVGGQALMVLGLAASGGQVATSEKPTEAAFDEMMKIASDKGGVVFFEEVLGHTPSAAARATALISLSGGWDAFVNRVKIDVFGAKQDGRKK